MGTIQIRNMHSKISVDAVAEIAAAGQNGSKADPVATFLGRYSYFAESFVGSIKIVVRRSFTILKRLKRRHQKYHENFASKILGARRV